MAALIFGRENLTYLRPIPGDAVLSKLIDVVVMNLEKPLFKLDL